MELSSLTTTSSSAILHYIHKPRLCLLMETRTGKSFILLLCAYNALEEVTYDSCAKSVCVAGFWLSDHGPASISRGGDHCLACRLDLPDPALRLASYRHHIAAQVQPWFAG